MHITPTMSPRRKGVGGEGSDPLLSHDSIGRKARRRKRWQGCCCEKRPKHRKDASLAPRRYRIRPASETGSATRFQQTGQIPPLWWGVAQDDALVAVR